MKRNFLKKFFVSIASFSLLFNSLATPLAVFAQELTPTPEPTPVETPIPAPTDEPTISPTPTEEPNPTPIPTDTPVQPNLEEPQESNSSAETVAPIWQENPDSSVTTINPVGEGIEYKYKDSQVKVVFTKLAIPGHLTIREFTPENAIELGAIGKAYEITSDMQDGTFLYDLTLPNPDTGKDVQVKYSEDGRNFQDIASESQNGVSLVIKDLNHFTVFIITDDEASYTGGIWIDYPTQGYLNTGVHYPQTVPSGQKATWTFSSITQGIYGVYISWSTHSNRATVAPYTLNYSGGSASFVINQELLADQTTVGGSGEWSGWYYLGSYSLNNGSTLVLTSVDNSSGQDYVIADDVRIESLSAKINSVSTDKNFYKSGDRLNIQVEVLNDGDIVLDSAKEKLTVNIKGPGGYINGVFREQQGVSLAPGDSQIYDFYTSPQEIPDDWPEGTYTVATSIYSSRAVGLGYLPGGQSSGGTFVVDNTPPSIPGQIGWTSENPPVGSDYVGGTDFANYKTCGQFLNYSPMTNLWGVSSDNSGIAGYEREVYSPLETRIYQTSLPNNYQNGEGAIDGTTYWVRVRASDLAGNYGPWTEKCAVIYDATPPTSDITSLESETFYGGPDSRRPWPGIFGTATDEPSSGVAQILVYIGYSTDGGFTFPFWWQGGGWGVDPVGNLANNSSGDFATWDYNFTPDNDGVYWVKSKAFDNAGNSESDESAFIFYDATPPTAVAGPDQNVVAGEAAVFDGSGSTDNSRIVDGDLSYSWDFNAADGIGTDSTDISPETAYFTTGTYTVTLTVTDEMGNFASDELMVTVLPPEGSLIFNELAWAGSTSSTADEWIELKNVTDGIFIDFAGSPFSIWDFVSDSTMLTINTGFLAPNGLYLIANNAQDYLFAGGESVLAVDPDLITTAVSLSNENLHLGLFDVNGNLVDEAGSSSPLAGYSDSDPNHKYSMARKTASENGTDPESWFTSVNAINIDEDKTDTNRGTPKAENEGSVDSVTFRWQGETYDDDNEGLPGNFEAVLFGNGRIQFNYGDGNILDEYPGVGLHEPGPEITFYSVFHEALDLDNALSSLWTPVDSGYSETLVDNAFQGGGVAQDFHYDDDDFFYPLPFTFPFFGTPYDWTYVSSNGYLAFDSPSGDIWDTDFGDASYPLIAALALDFRTDVEEGDDIYISQTADGSEDTTPPTVLGVDLSDPSPTKAGPLTLDVNFSENMDTKVDPEVFFGPAEPYNQHETSSEWIDTNTWRATVNIPDADEGEDWDGVQTIRVVGVRDVSGNEMAEDTKFTFEIDTKDPVITIAPYTISWTNQDIIVNASTNEGTLNASSHTFTENDSFTFTATDSAGNSSSQTVTITNIDKTAPVISDISVTPSPANNPPEVKAKAIDLLTNIFSALYSIDDAGFSSPSWLVTMNPFDGSFDSLVEWLIEHGAMPYPGEGSHTLYVGAYDAAGNFGSGGTSFAVDTTPPITTFDSPTTNGYYNGPITISGNSNDGLSDTVVSTVLSYKIHGADMNWQTITSLTTEGPDPFLWTYDWTPSSDGVYDIKAEATDDAGNTEDGPTVENITYDITAPTASWVKPIAGAIISGITTLEISAADTTSGVDTVLFRYKRNDGVDTFHDITGTDWNTTGLPLDEYTLRAKVTDKAENFVEITRIVNVAAVISGESSTTPSESSAIITWTTDRPTKSRVVYDTVSHGSLGAAPNYGYAYSTGTFNEDPKVLSHSVTITGLGSGTVYYYRTISEGSPVAIGDEGRYKTLSTAGALAPGPWSGQVAGISTMATVPWTTSAYYPVTSESIGPSTTEEVKTEENKEVLGTETQVKETKKTWIWIITIALLCFIGFIYLRKRSKKS